MKFLVRWFASIKEVTIAKRKDTSTKHLYQTIPFFSKITNLKKSYIYRLDSIRLRFRRLMDMVNEQTKYKGTILKVIKDGLRRMKICQALFLVLQKNLPPRTGSVDLRQLNPIHKKRPQSFFETFLLFHWHLHFCWKSLNHLLGRIRKTLPILIEGGGSDYHPFKTPAHQCMREKQWS